MERHNKQKVVRTVMSKLEAGESLVDIVEDFLDEFLQSVSDNITCVLVKFENQDELPIKPPSELTCRIC